MQVLPPDAVSRIVKTSKKLAKYLTTKIVAEGTSLLDKCKRGKVPTRTAFVRRYLTNFLVSQLFCSPRAPVRANNL